MFIVLFSVVPRSLSLPLMLLTFLLHCTFYFFLLVIFMFCIFFFFFFQAEDGIRYLIVTGFQTCALPIPLLPARPEVEHLGVDARVVGVQLHALEPTRVTEIPADAERPPVVVGSERERSEEHTSELQSRSDLVCRLLLEKKKKNVTKHNFV